MGHAHVIVAYSVSLQIGQRRVQSLISLPNLLLISCISDPNILNMVNLDVNMIDRKIESFDQAKIAWLEKERC